MHHINKSLIVVFIITAILGTNLLLASSVNAQTVTKPSVPEFTVKYVDASYDVLATTTTDPYTGATVTNPRHHVQNRTIQVSIENQQFTSYQSNGQTINLYLNVRTKGQYTQDWIEIYSPDRGFLIQSVGEYTTVVYSLDDYEFPFWDNVNQTGAVIDFQVEALIGYVYRTSTDFAAPMAFEGQESGWSNTLSVTVPAISTTEPSPTTQTGQPYPDTITIIIAVIAVLALLLAIITFIQVRKRK